MTLCKERQSKFSYDIYKEGEKQIITGQSIPSLLQNQNYFYYKYLNSQIPPGLPNFGNICFLNSIIQFLFAADSFKLQLNQSIKPDQPNEKTKFSSIIQDIFYYLPQRYQSIQINNNVQRLILVLEKINISYKANRFEDGLQTLMNILNMIQEQDSNITKCFNIQFEKKCSCTTHIFKEKYIQLSQQQCRKCGQKIKRQNLNFAKYIIYLNYKRLLPTFQKVETIRINKKSTKIIYKLISTINFQGQYFFGHYTATRIQNKKWFYFNDSYVRQASNDQVLSENGCILLYELIQSQNTQILIEAQEGKFEIGTNQKLQQTKASFNNKIIQNSNFSSTNKVHHLMENISEKEPYRRKTLHSTDIIQLQKNYIFKMAIFTPRKLGYNYYSLIQKNTKLINLPLKLSRSTGHKSSYYIDINRELLLFHDEGSQLQLNYSLSKYLLQKKINAKQLCFVIQQHLNKNIQNKYQRNLSFSQKQQFQKNLEKWDSEQIISNKEYIYYDGMIQ